YAFFSDASADPRDLPSFPTRRSSDLLTQLIQEALRASTDVRGAEARLTSTRASRRLAAFDLAPTITAIGSATRQRQSIAQIPGRSEEHTSELQSPYDLVCRLLLEKKK